MYNLATSCAIICKWKTCFCDFEVCLDLLYKTCNVIQPLATYTQHYNCDQTMNSRFPTSALLINQRVSNPPQWPLFLNSLKMTAQSLTYPSGPLFGTTNFGKLEVVDLMKHVQSLKWRKENYCRFNIELRGNWFFWLFIPSVGQSFPLKVMFI